MDTNEQADLLAKAGKLYRQGLINVYQPGKDKIIIVTKIWEEAVNLYRQAGDEQKAVEVEQAILSLYKKTDKEEKKASSQEQEIQGTGHRTLDSDFNDWNMFLKIGLFGFGGPMAVFGLLQDELVDRKKILTNKDFLEGAVLGDTLPGPVTMDIVVYTGYKLKKWDGAIKASLLFILPSFIMMLIFAIFYDKFVVMTKVESVFQCLSAAVTALIVSVGIKLGEQEIVNYRSMSILIWAFLSSLIFKMNIVYVVLLSGVAGILLFLPPPPPPTWKWWGKKNEKQTSKV